MAKLEVIHPTADPSALARAHMQVATGYAADAAAELVASMIACQALAEGVRDLLTAPPRPRDVARKTAAFLERELKGLS